MLQLRDTQEINTIIHKTISDKIHVHNCKGHCTEIRKITKIITKSFKKH